MFTVLVAIRLSDGQRFEGREAERGPEYACPEPGCGHRVHLKKPLLKVHHFAHEKGAKCVASRGETRQHLRAKDFLLTSFRARGLRAAAEVVLEILSGEEDRRADVVVWGPQSGKRLAFEAQHSMLELKHIMRRTTSYFTGGVPVVWLNLLNRRRLSNAFCVRGINVICVPKYTTHAWERWAHEFSDETDKPSMANHGHLWFLDPETGAMWRGWFFDHHLCHQGGEFYDTSGEYQNHADYWYAAERFRDVLFEGPFDLAALGIKLHRRKARKNGAYQYPNGIAAWLLPPDEFRTGRPKRPPFRIHRETLNNGCEVKPALQIWMDGGWTGIDRDETAIPSELWGRR
jgi:hypothetical protein